MDNSTVAYLVVLGICGLVGLAINAAKGKSKAWGFVGGFVFGIFGWVFLALHGADGVKCPSCRERVKSGATVCRHCGTKFVGPAGSATAVTQ